MADPDTTAEETTTSVLDSESENKDNHFIHLTDDKLHFKEKGVPDRLLALIEEKLNTQKQQ